MEEIVPSIVKVWKEFAKKNMFPCDVINIDKLSTKELLKKSISANYIIATSFNQDVAKTLILIREKFKIDASIIFYIHGFSSLYCWPLIEWGLDKILDRDDIFLATCQRDIVQLKLSLNTKNLFFVPFYIEDHFSPPVIQSIECSDRFNFYTISRISEQKNIQIILYALYLIKEKGYSNFIFHIFGDEDYLGSPNMGIKSSAYLDYLKDLTKNLKLREHIIFHGFINREQIPKWFDKKNIFLSASLHSDENFGVSVFRSLMRGHDCIISDWGGHADYIMHFPKQVTLVKTCIYKNGPYISPEDFSKSILKKLKNHIIREIKPSRPTEYQLKNIISRLENILKSSRDNDFFSFTSFAYSVYDRRIYFKKSILDHKEAALSCRIFESYLDPKAHRIYSHYSSQPSVKDDHYEHERVLARGEKKISLTPINNPIYHSAKVSRNVGSIEPCLTSMSILVKKITSLHFSDQSQNTWFPDVPNSLSIHNKDHPLNIIFFGSFFTRLLESGLWNHDHYKLFVLSTAIKEVMVKIFKFPPKKISVIPRYSLFPCLPIKKIILPKEFDLIFAGRLSATKNLEGLLLLVSFLQTEFMLDVNLHLFGDFDDEYHENLGRRIHSGYRHQIESLINDLPFSKKPYLYGRVESDEWISQNFHYPVFISLSTYMCEDYGVSVAQAQQAGWPCILSHWGGHIDVTRGARLFIQPELIPHSNEPFIVQKFKAKRMAKNLFSQIKHGHWLIDSNMSENNFGTNPQKISNDEVTSYIRHFSKSIKMECISVLRGGISIFADSKYGLSFFNDYEEKFSIQDVQFDIAVIIYDMDDVKSKLNYIELEKLSRDKNVCFLSSKKLFQKRNLNKLITTNIIYANFEIRKNKVLNEKLSQFINTDHILLIVDTPL